MFCCFAKEFGWQVQAAILVSFDIEFIGVPINSVRRNFRIRACFRASDIPLTTVKIEDSHEPNELQQLGSSSTETEAKFKSGEARFRLSRKRSIMTKER